MRHPMGGGLPRIDEAIAELSRRGRGEIRRGLEDDVLARGGMLQLEAGRVEVESSRGGAPIQDVPKERHPLPCGMDADLMGPSRHGLRLDPGQPPVASHHPEPRLRGVATLPRDGCRIAVAHALKTVADHEGVAGHGSVGRT